METIGSAQKIILTDYDVDTLQHSDIWFRSLAYPKEARLEMIRRHYLTQIGTMIAERKRFKETDFSTVFKPTEDPERPEGGYVLEITYSYEPQYKFVATIPPTDEMAPRNIYTTVTASPGHMLVTESTTSVSVHQLSDYIRGWLQRLDDELSSIPIQRELEEQRQEIDSIFEQLGHISTDYFSRQEAEYLKHRLDDLEARLTQNIQDTIEDQTEVQTKVAEIKNEVSVLKEDVSILNKRGWAKSLMTRTFEWAKDPANAKMLAASGVEFVKKLLEAGDQTPK